MGCDKLSLRVFLTLVYFKRCLLSIYSLQLSQTLNSHFQFKFKLSSFVSYPTRKFYQWENTSKDPPQEQKLFSLFFILKNTILFYLRLQLRHQTFFFLFLPLCFKFFTLKFHHSSFFLHFSYFSISLPPSFFPSQQQKICEFSIYCHFFPLKLSVLFIFPLFFL